MTPTHTGIQLLDQRMAQVPSKLTEESSILTLSHNQTLDRNRG